MKLGFTFLMCLLVLAVLGLAVLLGLSVFAPQLAITRIIAISTILIGLISVAGLYKLSEPDPDDIQEKTLALMGQGQRELQRNWGRGWSRPIFNKMEELLRLRTHYTDKAQAALDVWDKPSFKRALEMLCIIQDTIRDLSTQDRGVGTSAGS